MPIPLRACGSCSARAGELRTCLAGGSTVGATSCWSNFPGLPVFGASARKQHQELRGRLPEPSPLRLPLLRGSSPEVPSGNPSSYVSLGV